MMITQSIRNETRRPRDRAPASLLQRKRPAFDPIAYAAALEILG